MAEKWLKIVSYGAPVYQDSAMKLLSILAKRKSDSLSDEDHAFGIEMGKCYGKISRSLQIPANQDLMSLSFLFYSVKNEIRMRFFGFLK